MKAIGIDEATLESCIDEAQAERIVIHLNGQPVALIVGVSGMDEEQIHFGSSDEFWKMIESRRAQGTLSRAELEQRIQGAEGE